MTNAPLFIGLAEQIKKRIMDGTLPPGSYLPSIQKLQDEYDVSKNTVRAALRRLSEERIIAREGAARYGYRVISEPSAYQLEEDITGQAIAKFVLPFSYWNYVGSKLLEWFESVFSRNGVSLLFGNNRNSVEEEAAVLDRLAQHRRGEVQALILMTAASVGNPNLARLQSLAASTPIITLDRWVRGLQTHHVGVNNRKIGYTAARHLIERGHTNIGFATSFAVASSVQDRLLGYREAMQEAALPIPEHNLLLNENLIKSLSTIENAADTISCQLEGVTPLPTAFVCASDKSALGLVTYCERNGLRIPEDVAVAGCDNDLFVRSRLAYQLTSFDYPFQALAEETLALYRSIRDEPEQQYKAIELDATFVQGDTS